VATAMTVFTGAQYFVDGRRAARRPVRPATPSGVDAAGGRPAA